MKVDVRHSPGFACARVTLAGGESFRAESGAMMAHSADVRIEAGTQGGMLASLARGVLGGESLFMTTFTAPAPGGWVDVAPNLPGDIVAVHLDGAPLNVTKGCWLASATGVDIDTRFAGFRSIFGGEGAFLCRASGVGDLLLSCYGGLDVFPLAAGERIVVDSGHLVAYEDTVSSRATTAGGMFASMKSGEGIVMEFTGPGDVLTQSRYFGAQPAQVGTRQ